MILRTFISLRAFTVYMENSGGLKFHFAQFDRNEICTKVSTPEVMWMLIMKLPHPEVKFYSKVKSQICLSSLRVSCKRALTLPNIYDRAFIAKIVIRRVTSEKSSIVNDCLVSTYASVYSLRAPQRFYFFN